MNTAQLTAWDHKHPRTSAEVQMVSDKYGCSSVTSWSDKRQNHRMALRLLTTTLLSQLWRVDCSEVYSKGKKMMATTMTIAKMELT